MNAALTKAAGECPAADAALLTKLLKGYPGQVLFDEVVEVRNRFFRGHVYDLQSPNGWIVAQGIFTSNCECYLMFSEPEETALPAPQPEMVKPPGQPPRPPRPDEQEWTWAGGHRFKINSPELRAYLDARTAGKKVPEALEAAGVKTALTTQKALDAMTVDEQDMTPMVPQMIPVNPMVAPLIINPHDVETYEGVDMLLNRIASVPDQELMQIARKIWGDGYDYTGQPPEQARAEILGFLLDQRDLLGVQIDTGLAPSPSLLNATQPGHSSQNYSDGSGISPSANGAPQPGVNSPAVVSPGSYLPI